VKVTRSPAVADAIVGTLAGGALGFVSLEAFYGIVLAVAAGVLLFRRARRRRWFALGGFMLGMGLCAAGFLAPALTNHDPAVTYDPSTIPVFWLALSLALCGAVTLAVATTAPFRRGRTALR
jgi:dipeptide/tripeptide permease